MATLTEASVAGRIQLADQTESKHFSSAEFWRTVARTSADENGYGSRAVFEPAADANSALLGLVEDLRQAVRARDDFVAIAAHELRNAMTPIEGVAELSLIAARDAKLICPPQLMALLERMQRLVEDFLRRATKLLDVSRLETGNLRLEPAVTDLSSVVLSVARRYAVIAARKGSSLIIEIEDGIFGLWDPLAVEQIVDNLLANAIKFGMNKPVTLRLRSNKQSAWLEVGDCGMGMRPDQQADIFGRFEQAVTQHRGSGSGIGLWVVNCLVAAMNGQLSAESRVGEGSNFTVELPRQ
jgi:signal transduction histidine kinase